MFHTASLTKFNACLTFYFIFSYHGPVQQRCEDDDDDEDVRGSVAGAKLSKHAVSSFIPPFARVEDRIFFFKPFRIIMSHTYLFHHLSNPITPELKWYDDF